MLTKYLSLFIFRSFSSTFQLQSRSQKYVITLHFNLFILNHKAKSFLIWNITSCRCFLPNLCRLCFLRAFTLISLICSIVQLFNGINDGPSPKGHKFTLNIIIYIQMTSPKQFSFI